MPTRPIPMTIIRSTLGIASGVAVAESDAAWERVKKSRQGESLTWEQTVGSGL